MKKIFSVLALSAVCLLAQAQTQVWKLDKSHSSINFMVDHMVISETKGQFKNFTVDVKSDKADFTDAKVKLNIDVNSINTEDRILSTDMKVCKEFIGTVV
ncbi:MAG: YceI family protein [Chitinophagaceae bacterium]|nr:YceI family protein [Chitinophagaceae bacterium]